MHSQSVSQRKRDREKFWFWKNDTRGGEKKKRKKALDDIVTGHRKT